MLRDPPSSEVEGSIVWPDQAFFVELYLLVLDRQIFQARDKRLTITCQLYPAMVADTPLASTRATPVGYRASCSI
jgi:hypothetical protein